MAQISLEAIAILTPLLTAATSFAGILISSRLTQWRIEQLEKKVDKHNNFAGRLPVVEEQIKVMNHRINDLEEG